MKGGRKTFAVGPQTTLRSPDCGNINGACLSNAGGNVPLSLLNLYFVGFRLFAGCLFVCLLAFVHSNQSAGHLDDDDDGSYCNMSTRNLMRDDAFRRCAVVIVMHTCCPWKCPRRATPHFSSEEAATSIGQRSLLRLVGCITLLAWAVGSLSSAGFTSPILKQRRRGHGPGRVC